MLGHATFSPVGELVLANSHVDSSCWVLIAGVGPSAFTDRVVPGPSKAALCGLCRSYALVRRLTSALVRGRVRCWVVLNLLRLATGRCCRPGGAQYNVYLMWFIVYLQFI